MNYTEAQEANFAEAMNQLDLSMQKARETYSEAIKPFVISLGEKQIDTETYREAIKPHDEQFKAATKAAEETYLNRCVEIKNQ